MPIDDDRAALPGAYSRMVRDIVSRWVSHGQFRPGDVFAEELRDIYTAPAAREADEAIAACDRYRARITEAGFRRIAVGR